MRNHRLYVLLQRVIPEKNRANRLTSGPAQGLVWMGLIFELPRSLSQSCQHEKASLCHGHQTGGIFQRTRASRPKPATPKPTGIPGGSRPGGLSRDKEITADAASRNAQCRCAVVFQRHDLYVAGCAHTDAPKRQTLCDNVSFREVR